MSSEGHSSLFAFHCGSLLGWSNDRGVSNDCGVHPCPECGVSLQGTRLVASPQIWSKTTEVPTRRRALVLRASHLKRGDYRSGARLHIGVCDERGTVFALDREGVEIGAWKHCFVMELPDNLALAVVDWNAALVSHAREEAATFATHPYRKRKNNCFDFVVRFLNKLTAASVPRYTKNSVTLEFISPLLATFQLHRMLKPPTFRMTFSFERILSCRCNGFCAPVSQMTPLRKRGKCILHRICNACQSKAKTQCKRCKHCDIQLCVYCQCTVGLLMTSLQFQDGIHQHEFVPL